MDEEEKLKQKAEFRMFAWYILTEPFRKIKYLFRVTDRRVTPAFLLYILATITVFLFARDWKDSVAWFGALVVALVGLNMLWKQKRFINVYRKEHYVEKKNVKL